MRFAKFLLALLIVGGLATAVHAQAEIDELVVATVEDAPTMDPHMSSTRSGLNMQSQSIQHLIRRNHEGRLVPELALSWESVDDLTWRFHLRPGVKFHNGREFTADAVAYSLGRIIDPAQGSPNAGNLRAIASIEIVDSLTVDIHTHEPAPTLPNSLAAFSGIIDGVHAEEVGDAALVQNVVGTGPFVLVEWQRDDFARFERFEDYWGGPSHIRTLVLRPMPDVNSRVFALQAGEVDIIQEVPADLTTIIEADPNTRVTAVPSVRVHYIQFRTDTAPFDDARVRQAINYAVDKERIVNSLLNGYGRVIGQPVGPQFFGYNPDVEPYPYDPDRARALLAEAGYANGFETEFYIYPAIQAVAEVIASDLAEVGVRVTFKVNEFGVSYEDLINNRASPMHYGTWGGYSLFDADGTLPHVFREGALWTYYTHPRVDELTELGATTLDQAAREAAYFEAMEILHDEAPWLFLWQQFELHATRADVDWTGSPDNILRFYDYGD